MDRACYAEEKRRGPRPTTSQPGPWSNEPSTSTEWASLNAVLAKEHARTSTLQLDLTGIFALIEALEWNQDAPALDDLIPAAAVWVIFAGRKLKSHGVSTPASVDDGSSGRHPWGVGSLWTGDTGVSEARWRFWKSRFLLISWRYPVKQETKEWARKAWEAMGELDEGADEAKRHGVANNQQVLGH